ncbi:hypothetical protein [Mesorhizobium sp.]|uniref:hypothetical protein n=1 Tax=Mesorhizobium sp. TaxID=1871066 RepID=UPI000FE555AC|nr:hypothetical protein [Mesorhizobium sp.]RWP05106.1 MAG: hypothetical protein EOQ99_16685 [Mesorhizobium sp.]
MAERDFIKWIENRRKPQQGPPQPGGFGELTPTEPDWRTRLADVMAQSAHAISGKDINEARRDSMTLMGLAPGTGQVMAAEDAAASAKQGDYLGAALAALGAVPMAGKGAKVAGKAARDELAQVARPAQEKSGVFDYSASYPPRDLRVERFRPKKVPERSVDLLARPDVTEKMAAGIERGVPVKDWYETGPLRKSFEDQFGQEQGLKQFDQFIDAVAATSPRSDVGTNVRNASYYYGQAQPRPGQNSIPSIEDLPEEAPKPYGHLAQKLHRMNVEKTVFPGGGGLDFKANAKPLSFAANLKGDPSVATIDTHAFRAPAMMGADPRFLERSFLNEKGAVPRNIMEEVASGAVPMEEALARGAFWQSKPLPTEYAAYEDFYKNIGNELGLTPAETQAAAWVGHGPTTGLESAPKSFMDFVEERILKTAEKYNMDPRDVWRMALRGTQPLIGVGGAALGVSELMPGEKKQEEKR